MEVVELLLGYRVDGDMFGGVKESETVQVNAQDSAKVTPLMRAIIHGWLLTNQ